MAFKVTTFEGATTVDAASFAERGTFVVFSDEYDEQVFAIPTKKVVSIERAA
jgi:hypothetical protein